VVSAHRRSIIPVRSHHPFTLSALELAMMAKKYCTEVIVLKRKNAVRRDTALPLMVQQQHLKPEGTRVLVASATDMARPDAEPARLR